MTELDLDAHARALMDSNLYVTLGTADAHGTPWASPVCFATADYAEYSTYTHAATTVVHRPSGPHSADCVMLRVFTMSPDMRYASRRSSHAWLGSKGMPSVVASMKTLITIEAVIRMAADRRPAIVGGM